MSNRRIATIDTGTNSLLMLITEIDLNGSARILTDVIRTPRLGENLSQTKIISETALQRAVANLKEYKDILQEFNVTEIYPFATAAVREAKNQPEVLQRLSTAIGTPYELIPPFKEAQLTYMSAIFEQETESSGVVDIGGGSTEISVGERTRYLYGHSYPIGTVKLLGTFFKNGPSDEAMANARAAVKKVFEEFALSAIPNQVFGTAGSFTHLASLELKLKTYFSEAVNGFVITPDMIKAWLTRCQTLNLKELSRLPGADPRRVDLLLPGFIIIEQLQNHFGMTRITVRDRGMRYGKLFEVAPHIQKRLVFS